MKGRSANVVLRERDWPLGLSSRDFAISPSLAAEQREGPALANTQPIPSRTHEQLNPSGVVIRERFIDPEPYPGMTDDQLNKAVSQPVNVIVKVPQYS